MSQENIDLIRRALVVNRSGAPAETVEAAIALSHPDCEFASGLNTVEGSTYRGHDGIRQYFADLADTFREWTNETHAMEELDATRVLTENVFRGVSRSGVAVERHSFGLWTFAEGQVAGLHVFDSREEALEAAGLAE